MKRDGGQQGKQAAGSAHLRSIHIADVTRSVSAPVGHSGKAG